MPKMKVAVVPKPGADFEIQEREIPTPGQGQVRIKVQACGVCSSDHMVKDGLMPWIQYPRSPGHEVAGIIDELGPHVTAWKKGRKSASAGTAATTSPACNAVAAISSTALMKNGPASTTTAATPNT